MVRVSIVTWNKKYVMIGYNNFISKSLTSLNVTSVYIEDAVWWMFYDTDSADVCLITDFIQVITQ